MAVELAALSDAGLSPGDVLRAATSQSATCLGLDDRLGSIAEGLNADLLVLSPNSSVTVCCRHGPVPEEHAKSSTTTHNGRKNSPPVPAIARGAEETAQGMLLILEPSAESLTIGGVRASVSRGGDFHCKASFETTPTFFHRRAAQEAGIWGSIYLRGCLEEVTPIVRPGNGVALDLVESPDDLHDGPPVRYLSSTSSRAACVTTSTTGTGWPLRDIVANQRAASASPLGLTFPLALGRLVALAGHALSALALELLRV